MTGNVIPFQPRKWHCDRCRDMGQVGLPDGTWRYCSCALGQEMEADAVPASAEARLWVQIQDAIRQGQNGGAA